MGEKEEEGDDGKSSDSIPDEGKVVLPAGTDGKEEDAEESASGEDEEEGEDDVEGRDADADDDKDEEDENGSTGNHHDEDPGVDEGEIYVEGIGMRFFVEWITFLFNLRIFDHLPDDLDLDDDEDDNVGENEVKLHFFDYFFMFF